MTPRASLFAGCALLFALFPAISHAAPEGDATIRTDTFTVPSGERGDGQGVLSGRNPPHRRRSHRQRSNQFPC